MARTNFDQLLQAGSHFGHLKRKWNPHMAPYIFTEKKGIHIIDLHKTVVACGRGRSGMQADRQERKAHLVCRTKKQAKEL